jgi:uncharacterized membrane protein
MKALLEHVRTRPRMAIALAAGVAAGWLVPGIHPPITRVLIGWNTGVWLFLALAAWMMFQSDHEHLRRSAIARAEGEAVVLALVIVAAIFSIVAIVFELSAAKQPGASRAVGHVLFALVTVAGSWLLLPTLFSMSYASLYYREPHGAGLVFPEPDKAFRPDYADFLYFSFTIAVATQTADVAISTRPMRRLVLLQAVLSFVFNTTILALTINIAASLLN